MMPTLNEHSSAETAATEGIVNLMYHVNQEETERLLSGCMITISIGKVNPFCR
jgi:hypothetical protein